MSSHTETQWETVTPPNYRVTTRHGLAGVQVLDLGQLLGQTGCDLLVETLDRNIRDGSVRWSRTRVEPGSRTYQTSIVDSLPRGVSVLTVDLHVASGIAELTHRWTYEATEIRTSTEAGTVPNVISREVQRAVNRTGNQLLMHIVADQYRRKLQERIMQRHTVGLEHRMRTFLRAENQIQTRVSMRRRA
jgi:hypothetical protein